ncbi:trans-aconitate 2-methyltransferase [Sphingobium phenoxybenzoativorans]|uniref:Trans-aconitate 2-methyltransferase n=1 Tax=Sphingobium phenoxybenzoativorans TaxID=1592790 RepID=A0A975Q2C3_9SPHN|nr:trans-aconitate 2-methyltransferase [Sphingobium phenoxybenzoativorans]QUT06283.1 trans-aconitate 2-methyltransferase [Sphingobium phenoxybenzoativorans]
MTWSPTQYAKFEAERNRPVHDLIAQIPQGEIARAADIGCGPGNSTELLKARFPGARISGMDSSAAMIEAARARLPDVDFAVADIAAWADPGPYDVILANAALQWVPDHATLLPALMAKLSPGGALAVQMPDNLGEPAHRLMEKVGADGPWAAKLAGANTARSERHDPAWYYRTLKPLSARVDVWRTVYHHPLAGGAAAVVEWFEGTGLRPWLDPLDEGERAGFLARYTEAVAGAYPALEDGTVLLPFPRQFFVAVRRG